MKNISRERLVSWFMIGLAILMSIIWVYNLIAGIPRVEIYIAGISGVAGYIAGIVGLPGDKIPGNIIGFLDSEGTKLSLILTTLGVGIGLRYERGPNKKK